MRVRLLQAHRGKTLQRVHVHLFSVYQSMGAQMQHGTNHTAFNLGGLRANLPLKAFRDRGICMFISCTRAVSDERQCILRAGDS